MKNKILWLVCAVTLLSCVMGGDLFADEKAVLQKEAAGLKKELRDMTKVAESMNKERMALKEENNKFRDERAGLYEELGTAYTKAGLFDEAIAAYTKSLSYGPNNAQIHYYLGLLYQKNNKDVKKSILHLKKYLYLNPDAKNKQEVLYLIEAILNKR